MRTIKIKIKGESPLILHNGQAADPRNSFAKALKAVSGKRKKTDSDYDEMARIEFMSGLYQFGGDLVIPDYVLEAVMINGAKKSKRGTDCKTGMFFTKHASLQFPEKPESINEETLNKLFEDGENTLTSIVKVGMSKVPRTRPLFREWSCEAEAIYDPQYLNLDSVKDFAADAGRQVGIGDWRPKHGRFTAEVVEV